MTTSKPQDPSELALAVVDQAAAATNSAGVQERIYQAISVQRPVVIEYLKQLRREKPEASAAQILKELENRYVATVTVTSTGVGASAAIPGVGIPLALGLGVADLLFFYETSALFVLAATELQGIEVHDAERARPLVFGMLLGEKSQSKVTGLVMQATGSGGITQARSVAAGTVGKALPKGWGEVLTQQLPDSALAPLATVIAKQALKESAKLGAGTLGKVIPFGLGAVIGGVGSFTFGRDVVKAARIAFPTPPAEFPEILRDFARPDRTIESNRALTALQSAASNVSGFGEAAWGKATDVASAFRSVDLDGDGKPDEARALTAAKNAGSAIKGVAAGGATAVGSLFKKKGSASASDSD